MEPPFLGPPAAVVDAGVVVAPVLVVAPGPADALGAGLQADATRTAMAANTGSRFRSHNEPIAFTLPRSRRPAPLLATFGDTQPSVATRYASSRARAPSPPRRGCNRGDTGESNGLSPPGREQVDASPVMSLVVEPPIAPMLARLVREVPIGELAYEPKWDGFRCLAFRDGDDIDLRSRHDRPLARYFPEVVAALRRVDEPRFVLDGEIIQLSPGGFDFGALMSRLHPAATRVERLAAETPATYVAFDILATGDRDLRNAPFELRREELERLLGRDVDGLRVTPLTRDAGVATTWLAEFRGGGIDGVVAKPLDGRYEPARR